MLKNFDPNKTKHFYIKFTLQYKDYFGHILSEQTKSLSDFEPDDLNDILIDSKTKTDFEFSFIKDFDERYPEQIDIDYEIFLKNKEGKTFKLSVNNNNISKYLIGINIVKTK